VATLLAAAGRPAEARALADRVASAPALDPEARFSLAQAYALALASIRDDPAVERLAPPVPPA